jgi:hypothetical protein
MHERTNWAERYPRILIPESPAQWTREFAYAIGLIATDGSLTGGKTVAQFSKDRDLLETFRACVGTQAPIRPNRGAYRVQIVDARFYRWLIDIGITPRKSLSLGALAVPERVLIDVTRGLLDGDGSIAISTVVPNPRRYPNHTYRRLLVRFFSASPRHLEWLREALTRHLDIRGWIGVTSARRMNSLYELRYSKVASLTLLQALYCDAEAPRLERKWLKWLRWLSQSSHATYNSLAPECRNR